MDCDYEHEHEHEAVYPGRLKDLDGSGFSASSISGSANAIDLISIVIDLAD